MPGNAEYIARFKQWRQNLNKDDHWCIMINADPDALASALALKRIMLHKVHSAEIMRINEVTRPDNLAMIRYLRIPVKAWQPERKTQFNHFAIVDSQPQHNKAFQGIPFELIIDHHPLPPEFVCSTSQAAFCDIRPGIGATSTMMTRFLQALRMRPGPRLATALLYGIRTDTAAFERSGRRGGSAGLPMAFTPRRQQPPAPDHSQRIPARLVAALFARLPLPDRLPGRRGIRLAQRGQQRGPAGGRGRLFHQSTWSEMDCRQRHCGQNRDCDLPGRRRPRYRPPG